MWHAYGNANGDAHIHSDSDCDGNCHIHTDGDSDGDSNAYTDSNGDSDGNIYSYGYSYSNCHSYSDHTAAAFTDAATTADTAASSLALFGITGTRENELASSQFRGDRLGAAER